MTDHAGSSRQRRGRLLITAVFALLLAGWAIGIWATMLRGTVQEVTGTFIARPSATMILVRHDALPPLGMQPMELMAVEVDAREVIDHAALQPGDRLSLTVRQRPDRVIALKIRKSP
jgi:hypothetical protein